MSRIPILRTGVTLVTLLAFTACTTLQALPDAQPATLQQSLHPGDTVEIERTDGSKHTLKVEGVTADALQGTEGKASVRIPFTDIRSASTKVMTTSDKVWTVVGVVAVIGALIAAVSGGGGGGGSGY